MNLANNCHFLHLYLKRHFRPSQKKNFWLSHLVLIFLKKITSPNFFLRGHPENDNSCWFTVLFIRVDIVRENHDKVPTQWRHMLMGQFCGTIFLIWNTSTYFWALEVFKNQSFKSQLFWSFPQKLPQIEIMA